MRRSILVVTLLALACALPATAEAHPLGNFSVNHLTTVAVSADRVELRYVLDEAEIPTFQARGVPDAELLARKQAEVRRRLVLTVDGRDVPLAPAGRATLTHPAGQGGLDTTRVEIPLAATVRDPRDVAVRDGTFPGRVGWKAIVAEPGRGTAVRSSVPAGDPTDGLRSYPSDLLSSPADTREARLAVEPGAGTLSAPDGRSTVAGPGAPRADEGFTKVFGDAAAGQGVLVLLLLAAFGWGAVHALSPGHGKAMVAAYLVGTRGTPRQAVALGAIVTVTHTAGVFALGAVTLALSAYLLPETLYPWLNLVSGLLVVGIGAVVLRANLRRRRALRSGHAHGHGHDHHHDQTTHGARPRPRARPLAPAAAAGLARAARDGRRRRPDPVPVRPGRAARGDLPGPGGARDAPDRRVQRRPGRDPHRARARRRARHPPRAPRPHPGGPRHRAAGGVGRGHRRRGARPDGARAPARRGVSDPAGGVPRKDP